MRNLLCFGILLTISAVPDEGKAATNNPTAIPWSQIGAKAGADYKGDGLAMTPNKFGARLHCVFQRLDGEATPKGLWLTSTVTNTINERFRVTAVEIGRKSANSFFDSQGPEFNFQLAAEGSVSVKGQTVCFSRPGLTEEYTVNMDGVRQDFIVEQSPPGASGGEFALELAVAGARVEPAASGAQLALTHSGRKIAYSRLRATDATGKELPARIGVPSMGKGVTSLAVVVDDSNAVYPVRIDPTFSDANWVSMGGILGADGVIEAAVTDDTGNLYIGGQFDLVGTATASNIAQWNGTNWLALGSGLNDVVDALAVSGHTLYAGGYFTNAGGIQANYVAQWNGTNWLPLGSGLNGPSTLAAALAVNGSTLYVGGQFTNAGGVTASNIAQWNGSSWSPLGAGINGSVYALAVSSNTLYVGGAFTRAGGVHGANYVAQWNGSAWASMGGGINNEVDALAVSGSMLYAGGMFTTDDGSAGDYIAVCRGGTWWPLGSGMNNYVLSLVVSGSTLYAGGDFYFAGGQYDSYIAQWNGFTWSGVGSGITRGSYPATVYTLAVSGSTLYAGGDFTSAGGVAASGIARWNGISWSAPGSGMDGDVNALAVSGSTLYVGGDFTVAGGSVVNGIAQWNGSGWSPLGSGVNSWVNALAVSGSTLYAAGAFYMAGTNSANNIAQWNGSSWSALGSGMNGEVYALAMSGNTLIAGGDFTNAGGNTANYVAQWNGSNWSALGSGMNSDVYALAVSGSTLYAGGNFTNAGGSAAGFVAQWNNSAWSPVGSGVGGDVYALAVSGNALYAGGTFGFNGAGGGAVHILAQWNGDNWSALGSGLAGYGVFSLAASGNTLFAGGNFYTAGSNAVNSIAQWNGSSWSPLGSGLNGTVSALAVLGSALYVGGGFTMAGTNVSAYAAAAILGTPPPLTNYMITLNVSPSAGGTVGGGGTFAAGSLQKVTATANSGYTFADWTENGIVLSLSTNYTFTLNSNVELVANFTTLQTNAFCTEIQTASSSSISYDSGLFTYTDSDASDTSEEHAILPLCGAAASAITSTNAWTVSISVNLSARTLPVTTGSTDASCHTEIGLVVSTNFSGLLTSAGFLFELVQENNTGDGDGSSTDIYPDGWYGTDLSFQAYLNGARSPVTPLDASQATGNGSVYLLLLGGTASPGATEPIDSATGILTLTYAPSNQTVVGTYNGTDVASYSLAGWGSNPPLALGVWGGSGKLLAVSSGTATASNLYASAIRSSGQPPLSIVTNSGAFGFTNGVFGFSISGPTGSNVVIQASADLKTWIPLQTNVFGSAPLYYSDSQSPTNRQRFYRAALLP